MRSFFGAGFGLELIHLVKSEHTSKKVLGERTDDNVIILNDFVEAVAGLVDAILGTFELYLQVAEVLVGLQVGIVLLNSNQTAECTAEFTLCLLEFLQFLWSHVLGIECDAGSLRTGSNNIL